MRRAIVVSSVLISGAVTVLACTTEYQQGKDDPNYGAPNALAGQKAPGGSDEVVAAGSSSGGASPSAAACATGGKTVIEAGACTVSWTKDVLPSLAPGNCAGNGCHSAGGIQPPVNFTDPTTTWTAFAQFKGSTGKFYINPCSIDPADSEIAFNLDSTAAAASRGVLMPQGGNGLPAAVAAITTWVKCGAPNN